MSRQPVCSGSDAVKAFRKIGYELDHQTGSHHYLAPFVWPPTYGAESHRRAKGTLRALIREAGLTKEQFTALL